MPRRLRLLGRRIGIRARAYALATSAGLVVAGSSRAASGAPFELAWSAPEGCPSREEIIDATYARLGESRSERAPELFVQGTVTPADEGFVITLALEDAARRRSVGERVVSVDEPECNEIVTPASVVLAMMIAVARPRIEQSGEPVERAEGPPPDQGPPVSPPLAPRPAAPPRKPTTPESPAPDRWSLGVSGVASAGLLPKLGIGAGIHASYWPRSLVLLRVEAAFEDGGAVRVAGGNVGFQVISGAARVGVPVIRTKVFELIPMVGGHAGVIQHSAIGYATLQNESHLVGSIGPGVLARLQIGASIFLESLFDAELILRRDRFHVIAGNQPRFVHEPEVVAGRLTLGLGYQFR